MRTSPPDEGLIQAYLDDELSREERARVDAYVRELPEWAGQVDRQRGASDLIAESLIALDVSPHSTSVPEWIQRVRATGETGDHGFGGATDADDLTLDVRPWRVPLARAAVLVVLLGALASGLPGSPVRAWLRAGWGEDGSTRPVAEVAASVAAEEAGAADEDVGVKVRPGVGGVEVVVRGLAQGGQVLVRLVDGPEAGVFAASGARFRSGRGQIEVDDPGDHVRVDLPRDVAAAHVRVNGRLYLTARGGRLELTGPDPDSTEAEIRFRVPNAR